MEKLLTMLFDKNSYVTSANAMASELFNVAVTGNKYFILSI